MSQTIQQRQSSYTLVEIIMVVIILGMMISILLPGIAKHRAQVKILATKANLENLRMAVDMFIKMENAYPDDALNTLWNGSSTSGRIYISAIPFELITNSKLVVNILSGTGGWFYNTDNVPDIRIGVNLLGADANGYPYALY